MQRVGRPSRQLIPAMSRRCTPSGGEESDETSASRNCMPSDLHTLPEMQMLAAGDPEMSARRRKDSVSPERKPLKDYTDTNGHIPRQAIPSPQIRGLFLLAALVVVTIAVSVLNHLEIKSLRQLNEEVVRGFLDEERSLEVDSAHGKPRVWIEGKKLETGYLRHVIETFEKLGYTRVNGTEEDWDVLWSHDYPFSSVLNHQLQPHQRVNHFPGCGYVTNKVSLATSELNHVPKAFHLPKDKGKFLDYAKLHPEKLWVKKSNDHRGIRVQDATSMDLETEGTFVQEFVHNPLLIDGKKFDIGIYVIMTSVEPLRLYALGTEALLRFCARPYHPFNSSDLDSYVVGDDYTPIWEIPSLKKYFKDSNLNMKETLSAYLRSIKKDPDLMWDKIEEAIANVYVSKQQHISKVASIVGDQRHFFEMVRFDFVVDEELNIYIMEANMSPNLSSNHFAPNQLLYEQVIFNVLSVAGIAQTQHVNDWVDRREKYWNLMVNDKDLSVFPDICSSDDCRLSCGQDKCKLCVFCLSDELKTSLKDAVLEHRSRWSTKRLVPSSKGHGQAEADAIQKSWFDGKCLQDISWCA